MTKNKLIIYIVQMASRSVFFKSFFDGTESKNEEVVSSFLVIALVSDSLWGLCQFLSSGPLILFRATPLILLKDLASRNSTISTTTKKCFNYHRSHLNILCGLITMAASTESFQATSERFFPALPLFPSMKQPLCIIHALGEWEVYRLKCFFEFF